MLINNTRTWQDDHGRTHTDTYDAQHRLTSQSESWKDAHGEENVQTLSHRSDGVSFSHSVYHHDGTSDSSIRTRDSHGVHETDESFHRDRSWSMLDRQWQNGQQQWRSSRHWQNGQQVDQHDAWRLQGGGQATRDARRLDPQTWDVRQRTYGQDGALRQEYESTRDSHQRFGGHHYRYTPQGVDRQTWWQGVQSMEQAPGSNQIQIRRLQQMLPSQDPTCDATA